MTNEELFLSVFDAHRANDFRQTEMHAAEPLVPQPQASDLEMANEKLNRHKSQSMDQIPEKFIKAEVRTIHSEIQKLTISIWIKDKLPQQWKESTTVPIYEKNDKTGI